MEGWNYGRTVKDGSNGGKVIVLLHSKRKPRANERVWRKQAKGKGLEGKRSEMEGWNDGRTAKDGSHRIS